MMRSFRRKIVTSPVFHETVGMVAASYLRLVWRTSRITVEPADIYEQVEIPVILAMWHGQHFMVPFIKKPDDARHRAKVLISRHRDGGSNARAAERMNGDTIRASAAHSGVFLQ